MVAIVVLLAIRRKRIMRRLAILLGLIVCLAGCVSRSSDAAAPAAGTLPVPPTPSAAQPLPTLTAFEEVAMPQWHPGDEWQFRYESPQEKGTFVWVIQREEIVDGVPYYVGTSGRQREIYWRKTDLAWYMDKVQGDVEVRNVPPRLEYVWPLGPGKRWEQTYTLERPRDRLTQELARVCQVEGAETISVPC